MTDPQPTVIVSPILTVPLVPKAVPGDYALLFGQAQLRQHQPAA
ncbi:hypothetical protein OG756_06210 [Streptomyces sp. NBC_01310]|nr:hypothetical protein OG756_06210 [Streptomyces sp. NBC_01310]